MKGRTVASLVGLVALIATALIAFRGSGSDDDSARAQVDRELNLALAEIPETLSLDDFADPEAPAPVEEAEEETFPEPPPQPQPDPAVQRAASPPPAVTESPSAPTPEPQPAEEVKPETPNPEAEPQPEPQTETETITVPVATTLNARLDQTLDSRWNQPGDVFTATLLESITDGERVLVPAGTKLRGEVTEVRQPADGQPGALRVRFDEITVDGKSYPLEATITLSEPLETNPLNASAETQGPGAGTRIGQGALTGAIYGSIIGGNSRGTLIGAIAGAVLGGASGSGSGGGSGGIFQSALILAAGSQIACVLDQPLIFERQRTPSLTSL